MTTLSTLASVPWVNVRNISGRVIMADCFSKSEVTDFLNFMKLPDGTSVVSDDLMEYLMAYGFFTAPASTKYHGNYEEVF